MTNPDELVDAVRDKLRAITSVVALVDGDENNILSYEDDSPSVFHKVANMETPSMVVAWAGNSEVNHWEHVVDVYLRLDAHRFGAVMAAICDSVAEGDSQKFVDADFHDDFEQLNAPVFDRALDDEGMEYPRLRMRFRQRSNS